MVFTPGRFHPGAEDREEIVPRISKFSFSKKAVLATQSSMCLPDNIKQIMLKFHTTEICACSLTLKGRWFKYLVYLNDFKTV